MGAWLSDQKACPLKVTGVQADRVGGFELALEGEHLLQVSPADSLTDEYSEHWRLFRPSEEGPHFVVNGSGVEGIS